MIMLRSVPWWVFVLGVLRGGGSSNLPDAHPRSPCLDPRPLTAALGPGLHYPVWVSRDPVSRLGSGQEKGGEQLS